MENLDITTTKFVQAFRQNMVAVARTGLLDTSLEAALEFIAAYVEADVQEVEGQNHLIKRTVSKNPHISLALLSARVQLTKTMGISGKVKWSSIKATYEKVLNDACDHFNGADSVMQDHDRFAASPALGERRVRNRPGDAIDYRKVLHTSKWSLQWFKQCAGTRSDKGLQ